MTEALERRAQLRRELSGRPMAGPPAPALGTRRGNLGLVLRDLVDYSGAREQLERALVITEAARGPDHPDVGFRRATLGGVLRSLEDFDGARRECELALAITEAAYGPDHPEVGRRHRDLGIVLLARVRQSAELSNSGLDLREIPGAREHCERALAITEAAYGRQHPDVGICQRELGRVQQAIGNFSSARKYYESAIAVTHGAYGAEHPITSEIEDITDTLP